VPQHRVLRGGKSGPTDQPATPEQAKSQVQQAEREERRQPISYRGSGEGSSQSAGPTAPASEVCSRDVEHDPGFWLFATVPIVVALAAAVRELLSPEPT
jgi:hypothetical protein